MVLMLKMVLNTKKKTLSSTYFFTASSGILLFALTNFTHQIKKKLGIKESTYGLDYAYSLPSKRNPRSKNYSIDNKIDISEKANIYEKSAKTLEDEYQILFNSLATANNNDNNNFNNIYN